MWKKVKIEILDDVAVFPWIMENMILYYMIFKENVILIHC